MIFKLILRQSGPLHVFSLFKCPIREAFPNPLMLSSTSFTIHPFYPHFPHFLALPPFDVVYAVNCFIHSLLPSGQNSIWHIVGA